MRKEATLLSQKADGWKKKHQHSSNGIIFPGIGVKIRNHMEITTYQGNLCWPLNFGPEKPSKTRGPIWVKSSRHSILGSQAVLRVCLLSTKDAYPGCFNVSLVNLRQSNFPNGSFNLVMIHPLCIPKTIKDIEKCQQTSKSYIWSHGHASFHMRIFTAAFWRRCALEFKLQNIYMILWYFINLWCLLYFSTNRTLKNSCAKMGKHFCLEQASICSFQWMAPSTSLPFNQTLQMRSLWTTCEP